MLEWIFRRKFVLPGLDLKKNRWDWHLQSEDPKPVRGTDAPLIFEIFYFAIISTLLLICLLASLELETKGSDSPYPTTFNLSDEIG